MCWRSTSITRATSPSRCGCRAAISSVTSDALLTGAPPSAPEKPFVLVPGDRALLGLERQPALHTPFARNFRAFLAAVDGAFDVCVVDTNPNPDIRVIAALASADFVLSPIQLNQEVMDGVSGWAECWPTRRPSCRRRRVLELRCPLQRLCA